MTEVQLELQKKVRKAIAEKLGVDFAEAHNEANLFDDLGADSLDKVDVIMEVERSLTISIPDDKAEAMNTVGDIVDYVLDIKG